MTDGVRIRRRVVFAVAAVLAAILAYELALGGWLGGDPLADLAVTRHGVWRYQLKYPGLRPEHQDVLYRRDGFGFRGRYDSPAGIDLLTVGGSNVEQRFADEADTWHSMLEARFRADGVEVSVVNAGIGGRSTFGHIEEFRRWFPQVPGLAPRFIMLYAGVTDMGLDAARPEFDVLDRHAPPRLKEWVKRYSALYRIFRVHVGPWFPKRMDIGWLVLDHDAGAWVSEPSGSGYELLFADRLAGFRDRIETLVDGIESLGARPILVTQHRGDHLRRDGRVIGLVETRAIRVDDASDPLLSAPGREGLNGVDHQRILTLFNDVIREVCRERGAICLDLANEVDFVRGDFYDHVHTTRAGAARIAEYLHRKLCDVLTAPGS